MIGNSFNKATINQKSRLKEDMKIITTKQKIAPISLMKIDAKIIMKIYAGPNKTLKI